MTLADRLRRGRLPLAEALRIAHRLATLLERAHETGVVHRDLKPANIVITEDGGIQLSGPDLRDEGHAPEDRPAPTAPAASLGTPCYMSPEQLMGRPADRSTNVWAFGCVLFEMLTGRRVFDDDSLEELFASITTRGIDSEVLREVPPALRGLVERCLEKEPPERLRDMAEARIELENVIAGTEESAGG